MFDFDGTLVRGDCVAGFLHAQFARHPWRRLAACLLLPLLPLLGHWRSAWIPASAFSWLLTIGRDDASLTAERAAYVARLGAEPGRWLIAPAVQRLREHIACGDRVVIVTGAEQGMAELLWTALVPDLARLPIVGSAMHRRLGGYVGRWHNVGRRKLASLAKAGLHPPFAAAYSDSSSDLAMLASARRVVLVAPDATQQRKIQRALRVDEILAPRED
nr:HAD family hydrolase [Lysobacter sp. CAU 1642]